MARPIDVDSLEFTGQPVVLAEGVIEIPPAAHSVFSASPAGMLTYQTGQEEAPIRVQLHDRSGEIIRTFGEPAHYGPGSMSPDGRMHVLARAESTEDNQDLWIYEIESGLSTRFTLNPAEDIFPVWTPDQRRIVFASNRAGPHDLYRKSLEGTGDEELLWSSPESLLPYSVSRDGRFVVFDQFTGGSSVDIWVFDGESGEARPFHESSADEGGGKLSPDGRWMAFHSTETGRAEIYVTPFPGPGRRWQISSSGGMYANWRADGRELMFSDLEGTLWVVPVTSTGDVFNVGRADTLFQIDPPRGSGPGYEPSPDFERIVVRPPGIDSAINTLRIIVNWPAKLEAP
jgi:Tol biopolymer transport system component